MNNNWINKLLIFLPALGLLCIICYSFTTLYIDQEQPVLDLDDFRSFMAAFSILTLAGIASLIVGGGLGFIFGIPKMNTENSETVSKYKPNTNLEKVSDWLSNIIIGIGLTQLKSIWRHIYKFAEETSRGIPGTSDTSETIFTATLIIYFIVSGFLISYLLTRLKLTKLL